MLFKVGCKLCGFIMECECGCECGVGCCGVVDENLWRVLSGFGLDGEQ